MTKRLTVALIGHPNCGKTTIFNQLTGSQQKVGNWAGVTVAKKTGRMIAQGQAIDVVDWPGIYSLDAAVTEYLRSGGVDIVVNIVDAASMRRHLFLTRQLLSLGVPCLLVVNMLDMAKQQRVTVDCAALAAMLGCPVIPMVGTRRIGLEELKAAVRQLPLRQGGNPIRVSDDQLIAACVNERRRIAHRWTETMDAIVLHPWLGIPVFLFILYLTFAISIHVGGLSQPFIEQAVTVLLAKSSGYVPAIILQGVSVGVHTVLSFTPQIGLLFLILTFLEDSGYMARAAFVMDRLMRVIGLPGHAFIPLILGFGCNVPAIMAARMLDNNRDRILTIMMAPFMSCGARLAIFVVFGAVFFPHYAGLFIFLLYVAGIIIAMLTGWLLKITVLGSQSTPLILEIPNYHLPAWRNIWAPTWQRLKGFVWRAGKIIIPVCILLNSLQGIFNQLSQAVTPVFAPMGLQPENWPAVVGLLTGVLAKEVVIGTLNALYTESGRMAVAFGGTAAVFSYLLFVLLYVPCVSTIAVIAREIGARWAVLSLFWSISIAYSVAVLVYQIATWRSHPQLSSVWILIILVWQIGWWAALKLSCAKLTASSDLNGSRPLTSTNDCGLGCQHCPQKQA